jgi:hypothetical protein
MQILSSLLSCKSQREIYPFAIILIWFLSQITIKLRCCMMKCSQRYSANVIRMIWEAKYCLLSFAIAIQTTDHCKYYYKIQSTNIHLIHHNNHIFHHSLHLNALRMALHSHSHTQTSSFNKQQYLVHPIQTLRNHSSHH